MYVCANSVKSRSTTPSTSPRSPLPVIDVGGPTLFVVSGDVQQAFASHHQSHTSPPGSPQSYRPVGVSRDLLEATDFITDAVTSLVRELNSGDVCCTVVVKLVSFENYPTICTVGRTRVAIRYFTTQTDAAMHAAAVRSNC